MYFTRLMLDAAVLAYRWQIRTQGTTVTLLRVPCAANGWHEVFRVAVPGVAGGGGRGTPAVVVRWPAPGIPPYVVWLSCTCPLGRCDIPCAHVAAMELHHQQP